MRLSGLQLFAITSATIISINETTQVGIELGNSKLQFGLYLMSAILLIFYVAAGPSIAKRENPLDESE